VRLNCELTGIDELSISSTFRTEMGDIIALPIKQLNAMVVRVTDKNVLVLLVVSDAVGIVELSFVITL